ncbi:LamG domain-containing protein [Candidatus Daviesbacteria bacterium]|nr:LamG domain-containing protein [Candidatus Daviesbacteria bacterium]
MKDSRGGEFSTDNMGTIEQGLIGYWKLDESSAGSAAVTRYDPFGPNNLTDKNTVASTTGKVGTAATFAIASTEYLCSDNNFDGTCDDLNADLSTGAVDFTVSAWVNLTTKSGYRRIASKDDGATAEWVLYYDSSSDRFGFGTRNSNESVLDNNGPVSTSTWYYLVGWHDAANDLNCLQINNGTPNCAATAGNEPTDTAGPFYIGSLNPSRGATNNYMDGSIDEVVFWKRILSAQERMDLYNSGSGQTYSGGGGFHGSALGINVLPAVADGFTGKGRNFDGSNDYVSIGSLRNAGSAVKSVEFWTYPTSTTDYFVDLNGSAYVWANAGTVTATGFTTPTIYVNGAVSSTIVANKWQHVAVTTASGLNASAVNIGKTTTNYMAGKIDEVKISDVARTADEIAESYRAGRDHRITKTISSTDLSSQQKIPFYVASDRQGTFLEATIGEGAFQNNENDTNTRALWHLEEQTGTSPYLKDSSGLNNNLTVGSGTTFVQGKFGKARSFNGTSDYLTCTDANCGGTSKLDFPGTGGWSMGAWINTSQSGLGFIVSKDSDVASGRSWNLYINAGSPIYWVAKSGGTGTAVSSSTTLNDSKWHYVVGTYQYVGDGTSLLNLYIDGKLDLSATNAVGPILDGASSVQVGAREYSSSRGFFSGIIDEPFIAATQLSADQVRQAFEIGKRTHPVTIDFKANLLSTDLITGSSDLGFNVDSTAFGASNKGDNLYLGDKVIVKEKVDSTEYIAQGTVTSVNTSTGSVSVSAWDASSTFPTGGFTTNAILFKWQREYFDITGVPLSTQRDAITTITLRPTDTSQGANVWLDDLKSAGSYLTTSPATITSTLNRYIQYRAIFSSSDPAVSASLASITTDYDQGPTGSNMSKVMRHGKWFNSSGILRPYWWAK